MTSGSDDVDVIVVGAGLAGLRCAQILSSRGLRVRMFESRDHVGGRLHSFSVDGYVIDQGFQLVNPGYPEIASSGVKKGFDFRPFGSTIEFRDESRRFRLANPLASPLGAITGTLSSPLTIKDAALFTRLLASSYFTSASSLLRQPDTTTLQGLRNYGLSRKVISDVIQPFLRGTLLSDELEPSFNYSRLLLKSFLKGRPSTHPAGIQALPEALLATTSEIELHLSSPVSAVTTTSVEHGGITYHSRHVVLATDATSVAELVDSPKVNFRAQTAYWWSLPKLENSADLRIDLSRRIGTSALDISSVAPERSPIGTSLVATPTITAQASTAVETELRSSVASLYGVTSHEVELVTITEVPYALPTIPLPLRVGRETLQNGIFLAGDWLETPSIQGALLSGRRAANAVLRARQSRID